MNAMTPQEVFDKVATHLLTQNAKAYREASQHGCAYHTADGKKCAVGCLIEIKEYGDWMEGGDITDLLESTKLSKGLRSRLEPHTELLWHLQQLHDGTAVNEWKDALQKAATKFGLEWKH